jgi:rRNA processing protein Gar1
MKKLGKIHVINKKGDLLIKVTKTYRMNTAVVNQQLKKLGKIVDIIGPAKNPYLVINTREAEAKASKGETVYLLDRPPKKTQITRRKPSKSKKK